MQATLRKIAYSTVLRPKHVRQSSQTLYETVLGCRALFEATNEVVWRDRASMAAKLIIANQLPDGGFDIGYKFDFGKQRGLKQATAPETKSLIALSEVYSAEPDSAISDGVRSAREWILKNTVWLDDGAAYLPYCPGVSGDLMVYNGVSFGAGALAGAIKALGHFPGVAETLRGYVKFLAKQMVIDGATAGGGWFYSAVQAPPSTRRIDYYHQAQQIDCHLYANSVLYDPTQEKMIRDATAHLVAVADRHTVLPYYSTETGPDSKAAIWGLASVVPALLRAASQLRIDGARDVALRQLEWIIEKSWTGEHFYEVVHLNGDRGHEGYAFYNPRSDAWVFEALAVAYVATGKAHYLNFATQVYDRLAAVDFSGYETHAMTMGKRAVYWLNRRISPRK